MSPFEVMSDLSTGDVVQEANWDRHTTNIQWLYDSLIPVSTIIPIAGTALPTGKWLWCHGQAINRMTYVTLFNAIGTVYGSGDGSVTFNIPDMRGRVIICRDNLGGTAANVVTAVEADTVGGQEGEETHTLATTEIPAHNHPENSSYKFMGVYVGGGSDALSVQSGSNTYVFPATTGNAGGGLAHNNMPPYTTMNYVIKY